MVKISGLNPQAAMDVSDGDYIPIVDDNGTITKKVTRQNFLGASSVSGWTALGSIPSSIIYNGNHSYDLTFTGIDLTGVLKPGVKGLTTRTTAAQAQATSLNGTNQYFVKTSPTVNFTDDYSAGAWIKLANYVGGSNQAIISRYNGTSGWELSLANSGQVVIHGYNGGSGNVSYAISYQSVPLNKWVHVAAQLDMSAFTATTTTSYVMLDGVDVAVAVIRAGTNPTALVQAGNLEIGSRNTGAAPFGGKIVQAFVAPKITQANMKIIQNQGLTSALITSLGIISAYSFDGVITDLNTTTANNLTAMNSATALNIDAPFGKQSDDTNNTLLDYFISMKSVYSAGNTVATVQVPEGCTIPTSGTLASVSYSISDTPAGFPKHEGKWTISSLIRTSNNNGAISTGNYTNIAFWRLLLPAGDWSSLGYSANTIWTNGAAPTYTNTLVGLSTSASSFTSDLEGTKQTSVVVSSAQSQINTFLIREMPYSASALTTIYAVEQALGNNQTIIIDGSQAPAMISAVNAYI